MSNNKSLIVFAWTMELVGVSGGIVNSAYTTFGERLPDTLLGYLPAIPMAALAAAELGRVPLASAVFRKRQLVQLVAVSGIFALGYVAIENWTFGFERIVDLRLRPVTLAAKSLSAAEADLSSLRHRRERVFDGRNEKREELKGSLIQWQESIDRTSHQLEREAKSHQENLIQIREACRLVKDRCMVQRSNDEDQRYSNEVRRLNDELTGQQVERDKIHGQIQDLTRNDSEEVLSLDRQIASSTDQVKDRRQEFRDAAQGNQIYRLAASWFGVNVCDVTPEQFSFARLVFSTFSAIAVSLAGTVAAMVYYSHDRAPNGTSPFTKLISSMTRARRAYYARKRKLLVREVVGPERIVYKEEPPPPVVVEKEVLRFVDRIILIPRFGIRFPIYLNRLFGDKSTQQSSNQPNVMAFSKRGA
jgi:hypothetical protein